MRLSSLLRVPARHRGGPVILLYHRVDRCASDPQLLSVTPEHFAEHIELLAERYEPLPLRDLVAALRDGELPSRAVAITFDDGYIDNLTRARPVLARKGVPATVFVASGWIGRERAFWWDELEALLLRPGQLPPVLQLDISTERLRWELGGDALYSPEAAAARSEWTVLDPHDPGPRQRVYRDLAARLRLLDEPAREHGLDALRSVVEKDETTNGEPGRPLSVEELRQLAADELVDIGAHTVTHPTLAALAPERQHEEVAGSRVQLEELLDRPVTSFAYPYGGPGDFDHATTVVVRDAGFDHACANVSSRLRDGVDAYCLPRVLIRDWDGAELERRLADVPAIG